jgi:hypothetical protein
VGPILFDTLDYLRHISAPLSTTGTLHAEESLDISTPAVLDKRGTSMTRLLDGALSEGFETLRLLITHSGFTTQLGKYIRAPGGVERAIDALNNEFVGEDLWVTVSSTEIQVNLGMRPRFQPAYRSYIPSSQVSGLVSVENRDGDLYVDNRKIELIATQDQRCGSIGRNVLSELEGRQLLHPNIIDALLQNTHLIPENWKPTKKLHRTNIFFSAVQFSSHGRQGYIRLLYWHEGSWCNAFKWSGDGWFQSDLTAVYEE